MSRRRRERRDVKLADAKTNRETTRFLHPVNRRVCRFTGKSETERVADVVDVVWLEIQYEDNGEISTIAANAGTVEVLDVER